MTKQIIKINQISEDAPISIVGKVFIHKETCEIMTPEFGIFYYLYFRFGEDAFSLCEIIEDYECLGVL